MPYIHTCNRCKRKATSQDGSRPTCTNRKCRDSRRGGEMGRGMYVPPCAACGGELCETPSGFLTCSTCEANGLMTLETASKKYDEKMRPQWDEDERNHKAERERRTEEAAQLPLATRVDGVPNIYRLDDRKGWFRVCKENADGAIKTVILNPDFQVRRGRNRVGFVRPAKRIGSITIPKSRDG